MKRNAGRLLLKNLVFLTIYFLGNAGSTIAQTITLFPSPNPADYGLSGQIVPYNNYLYFPFTSVQGNKLAKFSDTSYDIINIAHSIQGPSVVFNGSLYYIFQASPNRLGRINADNSVTLINNPDNGIGFTQQPIIYNGKLYCPYMNLDGTLTIAVYDGNTTTLLPKPDAGAGFRQTPLVHNNQLFWIYQDAAQQNVLTMYDGSTLSVIPHQGQGPGIRSELAVLNNQLYFSLNDSLAQYNGSTVSNISLPYGYAVQNMLGVQGDRLWFKTRLFTQDYRLASFNGNAVELFGQVYAYNIGLYGPLLFNNRLYFSFDSPNDHRSLAYIEDNSLTIVPLQHPQDPGYTGPPVIYNDALYFGYFVQGDNGKHLARFDGEQLSVFPHPATTQGLSTNGSAPVVFKGSLYFGYASINNGTHINLARYTDSVSITSACAGSNLSLQTNLSGSSYQWQLKIGGSFTNISNNANYSGVNSPALLISNLPAAFAGYKYRCIVNGSISEVHTLQISNEWIGTASSSWHNPANWSCGIVPDSYTDVIISSGNVLVTNHTSIRSLQLMAPASLTVTSGKLLEILQVNQ